MSKSPLISIIVNTKNEEKHLAGCLESCLNQNYKNIEIIVVDNNSTDQTKVIAGNYTSQIYNRGPERSSQKNFGAKRACGEYLLFLDADAQLTKNVLSECVALAQNKNYSMVIIPERHVGEGFWAGVKALERSFYLGDDTVEAPWFFNKRDFLSVGGYDEKMFAGEDWDLFDRLRSDGFKYGRCAAFINHQIGKISALGMIKKKYYYGTNIKVFLSRGAGKGALRNPLFRPALFQNTGYLFKSPIKYLAVFAFKFLESLGIFAGIVVSLLKRTGYSGKELSNLMTDVFYARDAERVSEALIEMDRKSWIRLLKIFSGNRLLYHLSLILRRDYAGSLSTSFRVDLDRILKVAGKKVEKTERTLDYIAERLSASLLVKTYKFIPYITYDLDILVSSKKQLEGFRKEQHPGKQDKFQKNYFHKDFLRIDLHEDFYWQGFKFVDVEKVFEKTQTVTYFGQQVTIPSYTFEFLLNCAHILFEKRYITFQDFYYLKKLVDEEKIDWSVIKKQTEKYGWSSALGLLLKEIKGVKEVKEGISFPIFLSARKIAKIYWEKCLFDKKLPLVDMLYYAFARTRGKLGIKTRYPYYLHWFAFEKL